jgi:hypothetical protein
MNFGAAYENPGVMKEDSGAMQSAAMSATANTILLNFAVCLFDIFLFLSIYT